MFFKKHKTGHWGWSVKPQEAIVLPVPWTGDVRTSQGTCSKHSSWVLNTSFLITMAKRLAEITQGRKDFFQLGVLEVR